MAKKSCNIETRPGMKVVFLNANVGLPTEQKQVREYGLGIGELYTIQKVTLGNVTKVELMELPTVQFNPAHFEDWVPTHEDFLKAMKRLSKTQRGEITTEITNATFPNMEAYNKNMEFAALAITEYCMRNLAELIRIADNYEKFCDHKFIYMPNIEHSTCSLCGINSADLFGGK